MKPEGEWKPMQYIPSESNDDDDDMIPECEACNGTGTVTVENVITTDSGTKWKRSASEWLRKECPVCGGSGLEIAE